jgi:hypothetical protein
VKLAEREGFSRLSPNPNVFNGFELTPDHPVYQWRVPKSSSYRTSRRLPLGISLVVVPYLTILMDIGSWWLTKYLDPAFFSYVVIAGGACMGLALAAQILIALWEMWIEPFKKAT